MITQCNTINGVHQIC